MQYMYYMYDELTCGGAGKVVIEPAIGTLNGVWNELAVYCCQ